MEDRDLEQLLADLESDQVERKASVSDRERIREAICAFANDLPDHRAPGVLFIGVNDDGSCADLQITDELLRTLADMRSDGNIVPLPSMIVQKRRLKGCELAVVIVHPSQAPPVRLRGRVWIRVGPRRSPATADEERRLAEKRRYGDLPYDLTPAATARLEDLDIDLFQRSYLRASVAPDVLEQNDRTLDQQLASLRLMTSGDEPQPTICGVLVIGKDPPGFVPGAYVQFLRLDGDDLSAPVIDEAQIAAPVAELIPKLEEKIEANIATAREFASKAKESVHPDYPVAALRQLVRNAVLHRNYQGTAAPVRMNWFAERIEIQNPGGPFGQITRANFGQPGITDYRNPHLAEAMRNLGYVQRFGAGIPIARRELQHNGNPPLEFRVEDTHVVAIVRRRP
ncbi:MAG: putative DNA binding domain-containing protein [Acidobacteria bacterium]|nr:putative DNA binding domain-containing protein [Acidobacteriota bacterium]